MQYADLGGNGSQDGIPEGHQGKKEHHGADSRKTSTGLSRLLQEWKMSASESGARLKYESPEPL